MKTINSLTAISLGFTALGLVSLLVFQDFSYAFYFVGCAWAFELASLLQNN